MEEMIHVSCPNCGRSRLFDLEKGSAGSIAIKCSRCRSVVTINLDEVEEDTKE